MPDSCISWITHEVLWQTSLQSTSFFMATSVLLRTLSPNFRLTAALPTNHRFDLSLWATRNSAHKLYSPSHPVGSAFPHFGHTN